MVSRLGGAFNRFLFKLLGTVHWIQISFIINLDLPNYCIVFSKIVFLREFSSKYKQFFAIVHTDSISILASIH
jgi:hypothetical protein